MPSVNGLTAAEIEAVGEESPGQLAWGSRASFLAKASWNLLTILSATFLGPLLAMEHATYPEDDWETRTGQAGRKKRGLCPPADSAERLGECQGVPRPRRHRTSASDVLAADPLRHLVGDT